MEGTNLHKLVKEALEENVEGGLVDSVGIETQLEAIARRLHDRDGWVDWKQIWADVYGEATAIIIQGLANSYGRKRANATWTEVCQIVEAWYEAKR